MAQQFSQLEYTRVGSGEPMVLIHGIGHRRQAWDPVLQQLANSFEVFAIDLAGFGESAPYDPPIRYTMANVCADLSANFAQWDIERPHVVGNSLGGAIALELGTRDLVRSVTALSPAGFFTGADRLVALGSLLGLKAAAHLPDSIVASATKNDRVRRVLGRSLYEHAERISAETFAGDSHCLRDGKGFFPVLKQGATYAFAGKVTVPTTVAWGTRDKILLYGQAGRAQEMLPQARHVPLPACGHVPMIDDPDLVVRIIEQTASEASGTTRQASGS